MKNKGVISQATLQMLDAALARREQMHAGISRSVRRGAGGSRRMVRGSAQPGGVLEIEIFGVIGQDPWGDGDEITVAAVKKKIDQAGLFDRIRARLNSPGGDVFEGIAIVNLLRSQGKPVECCVDGLAASAASVVAMAGDAITMGSGAMMMIHNPWGACIGYADDHRQEADILDAIGAAIGGLYAERTGLDPARVKQLMDAETWLGAQACLDLGFATEVLTLAPAESERALAMARGFRLLGQYSNLPASLHASHHRRASDDECECECEACEDGRCSDCSNADCDDPHCEGCPMQGREDEHQAIASAVASFRSPAVRYCDHVINAGRVFAMRKLGSAQYALAGAQSRVSGVAAPFGSLSDDLGGFREEYARGCFDESLAAGDDARVLANHDISQILGRRSAGTARFWEEADGLHYQCDLPDTQAARDLAVSMRRGDIREASAAFYILQHRWEQRASGRVRVVEKAGLVEVSPHAFAAYRASSAAATESLPAAFGAEDPALTERTRLLQAQVDSSDESAEIRELLARQARHKAGSR